jgi:hypothetical protein
MTIAQVRPGLTDQLRALPDEAFTRLQYLAPATGCFSRCAFCSQQAGRDIWQLTRSGLTGFATAFADIATERGLTIGGGRIHRPGVLFPYLDNDIASYPHLEELCRLARDVLRVRLRISTVGYSSRSPQLTAMHRRITADHGEVFDGIRISLTPYTIGWTGQRGTSSSRAQFTADLANNLATYRGVFERLGHGPATAAVELRFAPLLGLGELTDTVIDGRHVLGCGPHLLISHDPCDEPLPVTTIDRLDKRTQPVFSTHGRPYLHVTGERLASVPDTVRAALAGRLRWPHRIRTVTMFRFTNTDGDYYAADPDFHLDGRFTAVHIYPRTATRFRSGYTDATRWFLNSLLSHKAERGFGRRDPFPDATASDIEAVLGRLDATADGLAAGLDTVAARHLRAVVIPLATTYADALAQAGYPPSLFFSRDFTIDTGQIVNQGRARGLFRGLVSLDGEPMTPREERGFGQVSLSTSRGPIWRIAPAPFTPTGHLPSVIAGGKNHTTIKPSMVVEELDPCHLRPVMRGTCTRLRRYTITGAALEHLTLDHGIQQHAFPGLITAI